MASDTSRLLSLIDTAEQVPYGIASINGTTWIHWADRWSPEERAHYLTVMEREFPDLTADVIDDLDRHARQEGQNR